MLAQPRSYRMAANIGFDLPPEVPGGAVFASRSTQIMKETAKVLLPNGAVLGVVTLTQIELTLKIALLVASLVYTILHAALIWKKLKEKRYTDSTSI